jgi:hypothetical protein
MDESSRPAVAVAASGVSAVSWAAILAGAAVAVASSLILFALATGLDLVAVSRSTGSGQVAVVAIGLVVTQWVSACLGGYVTGRLRTRWINTHTHEVFFRDTVHGFITWCVATIVVASGIAAASGTHQRFFGRTSFEPSQTLLVQPSSAQGSQIVTEQVSQVAGELVIPPGHESAQAGDAGFTEVRPRQAAAPGSIGHSLSPLYDLAAAVRTADIQPLEENESLRRDAAATSIFTSLSMLIGAFIASVSGALGGRLRDEHP